jgi:tetratricopeptide (TPR) repeat protein
VEVVQLTDDEPVKPARDVFPHVASASNATGATERTQPIQANRVALQPEPGQSAQTIATRSAVDRYKYRAPGLQKAGNRSEAERLLAQGVQAQERNRVSEAIEAYQRAAKADPSFFEAHYNLGVAAYESGDLSQTLLAYEYALAINPISVKARFNFAVSLQKAGYALDAAHELETLLSNNPDEPRAHFALANLYAQQLDLPRKAREHYLRVLELEPQHPQATAIRFWLETNR